METQRILGIDTGTNSIGWAVVDRSGNIFNPVAQGVHVFPEGVRIEKEISPAAQRSIYRRLRRQYYHRKLRKIRLLRILSDYGLCPNISPALISGWRLHKTYPCTDEFMLWQRTDDIKNINPYRFRHICLTEKLNLDNEAERYILGRALYHLAQRRGFRSNKKEITDDKENGKVKEGISELSKAIYEDGCEYLGSYLYRLYISGQRIRKRYTSRDEHYLAEFRAIASKQDLDIDLIKKLEKAIFSQRPIKSQKQSVGRCPFEPSKPRAQKSHPDFEEMRMLQFINSIRIKTPEDYNLRPLTNSERKCIEPLFYRKSKRNFYFEDIAKTLSKPYGKKAYGFIRKDPHAAVCFNYPMDTTVCGSTTTGALRSLFGDDWKTTIADVYQKRRNKGVGQIVDDVWHALSFFEDKKKLKRWAINNLSLDSEAAEAFANIPVVQAYASLSRKAISLILPLLRRGIIYSHAVLLAKLTDVLPSYVRQNRQMREAAVDMAIEHLALYDPKVTPGTLQQWLNEWLKEKYNVSAKDLKALYHPSDLDVYPKAQPDVRGRIRLGSPIVNAIRNPMAMRSLHRIRAVVNKLLDEGIITTDTEIHIEFGRELNNANMRAAIRLRDKELEKRRKEAVEAITEFYIDKGLPSTNISDRDILKYLLWREQNKICLYTGKQIGIEDFLSAEPRYDIEHTVPRSRGGDSSMENLTLCQSFFNRVIKQNKLPTELSDYTGIESRIEFIKHNIEQLESRIRRLHTDYHMTKEDKDRIITKRNCLKLELIYWKGKYSRFTMTDVPEGFRARQGATAGLIARQGRLFLQSIFDKVIVVKGLTTADFRKIWKLQSKYNKKDRNNHIHHMIDALVIACIQPSDYARLARAYHQNDQSDSEKTYLPEPWRGFRDYVAKIANETLVTHHNPDNMPKMGRRRISDGQREFVAKTDSARCSLHNDTSYGAIRQDGEIHYVIRKSLADLRSEDLGKIVDPIIRKKIIKLVDSEGIGALKGTVWMNEEKRIPIIKVRCYTTVRRTIDIRRQRDMSTKEYKRHVHVVTDGNYAMAIYKGENTGNKRGRTFKLISNLEAVGHFKSPGNVLYPDCDDNGNPLIYFLRKGSIVLLYQHSPQEIYTAFDTGNMMELQRRLYKVTELSSMINNNKHSYGKLKLRHTQEARRSSELIAKSGAYESGEPLRPMISMLHTQVNCLVEGFDFTLDILGRITLLKH